MHSIRIVEPRITVETNAQGTTNIEVVLKKVSAGGAAGGRALAVDELVVESGEVALATAPARLFGGDQSPGSFAYLENPRIGSEGGRGRATPRYHDGWISLQEGIVHSSGRDTSYVRRVCKALAESLPERFRYPVAERAKRRGDPCLIVSVLDRLK